MSDVRCLVTWSIVLAAALQAQQPAASPSTSRPAIAFDRTRYQVELEKLVAPLVEHEVTVGLVVGVIVGDQRLARGFGRVTTGDPRAPNADTVYEIGSITKVLTGILLADAVGRGEVKLDDPVNDHLPVEARLDIGHKDVIRLVHLSTHGSGLPSVPPGYESGDLENPYAGYSTARLYSDLARLRTGVAPGKTYSYSNLGAGLLGHVLARVAGKSGFEQLVLDRLIEPLGLRSTRVSLDAAMRGRLAPGYTSGGQPRRGWDLGALAAAGGIRSSANDLLELAGFQLRLKTSKLAGAMRLAQRVHFRANDSLSVGLGWHIVPAAGLLAHSGATGGYVANLVLKPERNAAAVVLANTDALVVSQVAMRALHLALGGNATAISVRPTVKMTPAQLRRFAGSYRLNASVTIDITQIDGALFARLTGQPSWRVFPASDNRFFYRAVAAELEFELRDGKAASVALLQNGIRQVARRIEAKR